MDRRTLLRSALASLAGAQLPPLAGLAWAQDAPATPFSFDLVINRARAAAETTFQRPVIELSEPFAGLGYDAFRGIRFRDDKRVFAGGGGFQMDMMPPGFTYSDRIEINVVSDGMTRPLAFSTDFFDFQTEYFPYPDGRAPEGLAADHGFSGIRFRHPINRPGVWDETLVFQGASYFRSVARDTFYGLSARGLAIGTAGPEPEEFPLFTEFWVEEPARDADTLTLYALLDGPSIAGAYRFVVTPGPETVMDISCALFPRRDIDVVGVAPLTSMYWFGPEGRAGVDDFRYAVHDSDGLALINGRGERLWRPLSNPPSAVHTSYFGDENPTLFGLMQRARAFEQYMDAEARYEQRPSAWVEPRGDWGRGAVVLVEIPTVDEKVDNIVAFWRPETPLRAGVQRDFAYRLTWGRTHAEDQPIARVVATRTGASIVDGRQAIERVFAVEFDLGMIDFDSVAPLVEVTEGQVIGVSVTPLPGGNVARVGFHYLPGAATAAEFRLWLVSEDEVASETWLYRWSA